MSIRKKAAVSELLKGLEKSNMSLEEMISLILEEKQPLFQSHAAKLNCEHLLETILKFNPLDTKKWVLRHAEEIYSGQVRAATAPHFGLRADATHMSIERLEETTVAALGQRFANQLPDLWNLITCLLCADGSTRHGESACQSTRRAMEARRRRYRFHSSPRQRGVIEHAIRCSKVRGRELDTVGRSRNGRAKRQNPNRGARAYGYR